MKVLAIAGGTRGDTNPFIALAVALNRAGHDTVLVCPDSWIALVNSYGINCTPVEDLTRKAFEESEITQWAQTDEAPSLRKFQNIRKVLSSNFSTHLDLLASVGQRGADVVVGGIGAPEQHLAEWLDVPFVQTAFQPLVTHSIHPPYHISAALKTIRGKNPYLPKSASAALNILLGKRLSRQKKQIDKWRMESLRLPQRRGRHNIFRRPDGGPPTVIQAFSRHALVNFLEAPSWVHTTGYWYLPTPPGWQPSRQLQAFLSKEDPPIYVGFGSMVGADPTQTARVVADALRIANVRAVITTGWGGLDAAVLEGPNTFVVDELRHQWLFPKVATVVHHGGAGTTAAALASGRPQVICPFFADQPFWANQMHSLGVASIPRQQSELSAQDLARAIHCAITDTTLAQRAQKIAQQVRIEDGVSKAVNIIEKITQH